MHLLPRMLVQKEIEALEVSLGQLQKNGSPATAKKNKKIKMIINSLTTYEKQTTPSINKWLILKFGRTTQWKNNIYCRL